MMTAREFYAPGHEGLVFGERYTDARGRIQVHRGYDVKKVKAGTEIPSPFAGKVARTGYDAGYGYFTTVEMGPKSFGHLCHLQQLPELAFGDPIALGDTRVGRVGSTGTYASGAHVHLMVTTGPQLTSPASDPYPFIEAAIAENEDDDMFMVESAEDGKHVKQGFSYTWGEDGILRPLGKTESDLMKAARPNGAGVTPFKVSAFKLDAMAEQNGILEVEWRGLEPQITGRIIRRRLVDGKWVVTAEAPSVSGSAAADLTPALDAIRALPGAILERLRSFWSTGK